MRLLSKTKLMSYLQCEKKLWLELNRPELIEQSTSAAAAFAIGHQVGELARKLYDPKNKGTEFNLTEDGIENIINKTQQLMLASRPIFEAGFAANGARAFADVMLPNKRKGVLSWCMVEVKSSTEMKAPYYQDVAIQAYVAKHSGVQLDSVSLAHINREFVYAGDGNYDGIFIENDLTNHVLKEEVNVEAWIKDAHKVAKKRTEPKITTGSHCSTPYSCSLYEYCSRQEPQAKHPVHWLPNIRTKQLKAHLALGVSELKEVPDHLLDILQQRVKKHSISKKVYFDAAGAKSHLENTKFPAYFLDFETISFAIPIWKWRKPFQTIPFQFSAHKLKKNGDVSHAEFLDLSGKDPTTKLARALIDACGSRGTIFAYNANFEKRCIQTLADNLPSLREQLLAINARIVDLLDVAKNHYYHPSQEGSWSIKKVLPAIIPELSYESLGDIQNGEGAMQAYLEAIQKGTDSARLAVIDKSLRKYCELDTYAMVKLWSFFSGLKE